MRPIIRAENVGKQFQIGASWRQETLRETIMRTLRSPFGAQEARKAVLFWALRDVSFTAMPGDVIGIIGRNGAGKSTLLKILARITEPTAGRIELYGRVGSLLEVGTGFHQDLTGRENVLLNGAILGMRRAEILQKFDEIVAFAEVEKFIDTPVKHYSSGMYLRLAFAVAAFLQSEILLVDEILAVGDATFQKKCLGKMRDVSHSGRTVFFVSHNMTAIESLCNRCLLISRGELAADGSPHDLVSQYLAADSAQGAGTVALENHPGRSGGSETAMKKVTVLNSAGEEVSTIRMGEDFSVQMAFQSRRRVRPFFAFVIKNNFGVFVANITNRNNPQQHPEEAVNTGVLTATVEGLPLVAGIYTLDLYFGEEYEDFDVVYDAISFEVVPADVFGGGVALTSSSSVIYWPSSWKLQSDLIEVSSRSEK
jgi:homopolymeric O-antigen transport system ATP-binding protein